MTRTSRAQMHHKRLRSGFTFMELIVVVIMLGLLVGMVRLNIAGMLSGSSFKAQVRDFMATMRKAVQAAGQSNQRYEVIIDLTEQQYILQKVDPANLYQVREEEVILRKKFKPNCWVDYVWFDDDTGTNEGQIFFVAGRTGWQYGGKIVFLTENDEPYTVIVNRVNRTVELKEGDVDILVPRADYEISF